MDIDSLFSVPVRSISDLASDIRGTFDELRRRPLTLGVGCGCAVAFSAVSIRDFEDLLVFHVSERWRAIGTRGGDAQASVPDPARINGLEELVDWVLSLERAGRATECRAILEEIRRSIASFVRQCSVHRLKAENV